jgi:hypothetical protein
MTEPVEDVDEEPAALGGARSPLVRALPQYERQFRWHVKVPPHPLPTLHSMILQLNFDKRAGKSVKKLRH